MGTQDFGPLIASIYNDPVVLALCDEGDRKSEMQTKHDRNHLVLVRDVAVSLTAEINKLLPGKLDAHTRDVIIPVAAYLHDIGRGIEVDKHASAGAKWVRKYLKGLGFDAESVKHIARIVACHRSDTVLGPRSFRRKNFADAAWAIVVIADKAVGDEDRVRPEPARELARLRKANRMKEFKGSIHDRVNYAIKSAELVLDNRGSKAVDPGVIVLKLRIDEEVAAPEDIYNLYGRRFHACGKAAQYLNFLFRLEFNGERYHYDKPSQSWKRVESIDVTVPPAA